MAIWVLSQKESYLFTFNFIQTHAEGPEHDWVNMLMNSPIFQQVNDISNLLDSADLSTKGAKNDVKGKLI